jgi:hypothetical protein
MDLAWFCLNNAGTNSNPNAQAIFSRIENRKENPQQKI